MNHWGLGTGTTIREGFTDFYKNRNNYYGENGFRYDLGVSLAILLGVVIFALLIIGVAFLGAWAL